MLRKVSDRYLPPDREAYVAGEPPTGRVIVIAPTRAACETIEIAIGLHLETYLETNYGERVRELARSGKGFGIVAGTGTGKTLAIRPIAEEIVRAPLNVGVVNREREATPELAHQNTVVVTTGIARRWFQDGDILPQDTLVIDEIHQTSAELELCLALGKRVGCRFVWLSATVDPRFYRDYLNSADVLEVYSFDPRRAADVRIIDRDPDTFLDQGFLRQVVRGKRGVGVFLPTRAGVEQVVEYVRHRMPDLDAAYYHGGEPIRAIRPFLEEEGRPKPYMLAMTAAGQSALNVRGLDTVVIDDTRFANLVQNGRNVLTRVHLGNNEILQMAGRVHGRVEGGRVYILSNRPLDFANLKPTAPDFQLAGNSERVALTCAALGVRADELDLPVPLDRKAYRKALGLLQERGIVDERGRLSAYGKAVEALPVDRIWGELIVNAPDALLPFLAVMASIESLHRMTREERVIDDLVVPGSDHLTTYNIYAEAYEKAGYVGQVYGLDRHLFDSETVNAWAEERGVLVKAIEDAGLGVASIYRSLGLRLPATLPAMNRDIYHRFTELLVKFMPLDLVIEEQTVDGQHARVSKGSVCGSWDAVAGTLRYFSDRYGTPRAAIEGTQIPMALLRRHAREEGTEFFYDARRHHTPLVLRKRLMYRGFNLEGEVTPVHTFDPSWAQEARRALAEALALQAPGIPAVEKNRLAVEEVRDLYRRSGAKTPRLGLEELTDYYLQRLKEQKVNSMAEFRRARLELKVNEFVSAKERSRLWKLPATAQVLGREVQLEYAVEPLPPTRAASAPDGGANPDSSPAEMGVVILHLPERVARQMTEKDLPATDRPVRFCVSRGSRGAVHAPTLKELQAALEGPWTPDEPVQYSRGPEWPARNEKQRPRGEHRPPSQKGLRKFNPRKRGK